MIFGLKHMTTQLPRKGADRLTSKDIANLLKPLVLQAKHLTVVGQTFRRRDFFEPMQSALEGLFFSFDALRDRYYVPPQRLMDLTKHGDIYANLLVRLGIALKEAGMLKEAEGIWTMNRVLHGLDYFPMGEPPPPILQFSHPVGTVIGRANLGQAAIVYQGVTIGASRKEERNVYPTFHGPTVFFANSTVLGNCIVGSNVVFAANSMIVDCDVPEGSIVVGQYPRHRTLPGAEKIVATFLHQY